MNRVQRQDPSDQQIQLNTQSEQSISQLDKVPEYMAFNKHITYGYRLNFKEPFQIIRSLFILHNQTINIWTHLIGSLIVFSFIICFFVVVDKAEVQYQLKNYQSNLNQGFNNLDNILHRVQVTLSTFQLSENNSEDQENFEILRFELGNQYNQITESVEQQINQINKILKYDVQLTEQQRNLRQNISQKLSLFQKLQEQFQSQINTILWQDLNKEAYRKAHKVEQLRKGIQRLQKDINDNVIEYLQLQKSTPNPYGIPRWPVVIFLLTATLCLGFSATFHLFYPMSSKAFKYSRRLDYAGVILNIVGTGIPPIYYALYCKPYMGTFYLTVMIFFGSVLFITLLGNWIHKTKNQKYKPVMFGLFGLTYLIPYTHLIISEVFFDNFGDAFKFSYSNFWWFTSSFSYLFGLYIFIKKWPQSKHKLKFDYIGSSHQIWHFLCLCGVAATYVTININYQTRKQCPCP